MLFLSTFQLLCLSFAHKSVAQWTVGQEVKTGSGLAKGHASKSHPQVSEYLGIRFAHSTEGENRFMPPKPYTSTDKIVASEFVSNSYPYHENGLRQCRDRMFILNLFFKILSSKLTLYRACPQMVSKSVFALKQSEDCLFVNVWTKPQVGEKKKAVLLWIFGGGFSVGSPSTTNGAAFANNQDLVVISIGYRVSVFGFPGAPGLSQFNPGFLDQRLAIEWARDNIAAFGGDPERIVIYGQSAGSMSVDDYAFTWTKDPIVNGFILSSGTALMGRGEPRLANAVQAKNWYGTTQRLGCGGAEAGAATIKCAQSKPWQDVYAALPPMEGMMAALPGLRGGFGPSSDNKTLFSDVYERARRGQFIRKASLAYILGRECCGLTVAF